MIDISKLTEDDKGKRVVYRGSGVTEWGIIRRWNDKYVFVLYTRKQYNGGQPFHRTTETAEATHPKDLEFANEPPPEIEGPTGPQAERTPK